MAAAEGPAQDTAYTGVLTGSGTRENMQYTVTTILILVISP